MFVIWILGDFGLGFDVPNNCFAIPRTSYKMLLIDKANR
jgi:hypothetical protein